MQPQHARWIFGAYVEHLNAAPARLFCFLAPMWSRVANSPMVLHLHRMLPVPLSKIPFQIQTGLETLSRVEITPQLQKCKLNSHKIDSSQLIITRSIMDPAVAATGKFSPPTIPPPASTSNNFSPPTIPPSASTSNNFSPPTIPPSTSNHNYVTPPWASSKPSVPSTESKPSVSSTASLPTYFTTEKVKEGFRSVGRDWNTFFKKLGPNHKFRT